MSFFPMKILARTFLRFSLPCSINRKSFLRLIRINADGSWISRNTYLGSGRATWSNDFPSFVPVCPAGQNGLGLGQTWDGRFVKLQIQTYTSDKTILLRCWKSKCWI